jgi:hypothetical protein
MFTAELEQDELTVEPGGTAKVQVVVANNGDSPGRYALEVEGIDPDWCAVPVPTFGLQPGEGTRERVLIKPPRSSESKAGVYPFVIAVLSLEDGERVTRQGSVNVEPFNLLTMELLPKRATVSPMSRTGEFQVTVANLGNTEQHLQLFASDPEDGCTYQFQEERVSLPPGGHADIPLSARPTSAPLISSPRLYGFSVSARSVEDSHVSTSTLGQLERRALVNVATLVSLVVLVAIVLAGWGFWPRPAAIRLFQLDRSTVPQGESISVRWRTAHANSVRLEFDGRIIQANLPPRGTHTFEPEQSGTLVLVAEGPMGEVASGDKRVTVTAPETPPLPVIAELSASPAHIKKGEMVTIHYVVRNADRIYLAPLGIQLETVLTDKDVAIPRSGTYTLVAVSADNKTVSQTFDIVVDESDADIFFIVNPSAVNSPGETVSLRWDIRRAVEARIKSSDPDNDIGPISPLQGVMSVPIYKTTTFTLEAKDSEGRAAVQTLEVPLLENRSGE